MPMLKDETGEYLIENLQKNGVMAEAIQVRARGGLGGKGLQNEAFEVRADVLVMGGFGHSRLREFMLGGATQGVLNSVRMPVLLSN
ncbi:universal stress protein [Rhizobium bangladeshense]|uniref:universal stress protein n=1 Tax=Rhizobium bangladeshense TaxID=1138189 RepID=UPI0007E55D3B|nr:universal stress protein [Rhizobium bangladeshense]